MPLCAAIDIGSNTVRMDVAEVVPGDRAKVIRSDRTPARIGESVFLEGAISEEAIRRVCTILERLSSLKPPRSRAVATSAVRDAHNREEFVSRASAALGQSIEVIPGVEEARLIQLGVRANMPGLCERPLIIDVGGGSTELIFGDRLWSLSLGALRLEREPLPALFRIVEERARPAVEALRCERIEQAIGSSATARVLCRAGTATAREVRELFDRLCGMSLGERAAMPEIGPNRAGLIVPGGAILVGLIEALQLPAVTYSPAALCAGIIADLVASGI